MCVVNSFFFSGGKIQDGTLDNALWVNSKIAAICARSNYKLIYFLTEYRPIHDFVSTKQVLRYARLNQ